MYQDESYPEKNKEESRRPNMIPERKRKRIEGVDGQRTNGQKKIPQKDHVSGEKKKERTRDRCVWRDRKNKKINPTHAKTFFSKTKETKRKKKGKESTFTHPLFHLCSRR